MNIWTSMISDRLFGRITTTTETYWNQHVPYSSKTNFIALTLVAGFVAWRNLVILPITRSYSFPMHHESSIAEIPKQLASIAGGRFNKLLGLFFNWCFWDWYSQMILAFQKCRQYTPTTSNNHLSLLFPLSRVANIYERNFWNESNEWDKSIKQFQSSANRCD